MTEDLNLTVDQANSTVAARLGARIGLVLLGISLFPAAVLHAVGAVAITLPNYLEGCLYLMIYFLSFPAGLAGVLFLVAASIVYFIARWRTPIGGTQSD